MYHSFPRRRKNDVDGEKGLRILRLIAEHGLLLTPEILHWRETKADRTYPQEEYTQVSKRCCFTELSETELPRHAAYFGEFALEFDHRTICDMGALPVFYIPRMSSEDDYGVGPAIVTQLAHVQDLTSRLTAFKQFANAATVANPNARIGVVRANDGGYVLFAEHTEVELHLPKEIIAQAQRQNRDFAPPELPEGPASLGFNAQALLTLLNMLNWGLHDPGVLTGMVKALGCVIHPTERAGDPLLSYYQQREWRLIAGVLKDTSKVDKAVPQKLREELLDLDREFFGRELTMPQGKRMLVDECVLCPTTPSGSHVMRSARRVFCSTGKLKAVREIMTDHRNIEVVSIDAAAPNAT